MYLAVVAVIFWIQLTDSPSARQHFVPYETTMSIQNPGEILPLAQTWPGGDAWKTAAGDQSAEDVRQPRDMTVRYQREEDRHLAEAAAGD